MSNQFQNPGINLATEIRQVFDPSSIPADGKPIALIITGPVASGKTTHRRTNKSKGFVVLDAGEIFLSLCSGRYFDFPTVFKMELDWVGLQIAKTAIAEKRNLVCELNALSCPEDRLIDLLQKFNAREYKMSFEYIHCDVEEAWKRNLNRSNDCISSVYTDEYHWKWLYEALQP